MLAFPGSSPLSVADIHDVADLEKVLVQVGAIKSNDHRISKVNDNTQDAHAAASSDDDDWD